MKQPIIPTRLLYTECILIILISFSTLSQASAKQSSILREAGILQEPDTATQNELNHAGKYSANDATTGRYAIISGYVFNDINLNGIRDAGEALIPHRAIILYKTGPLKHLLTNTSGKFSFIVYDTGWYNVEQTVLFPSIQTFPANAGGFQVHISDFSTNVTDLGFGSHTLVSSEWCTVGGYVYNDLNMNGVRDPGEPGIPGIRVYSRGYPLYIRVTDSEGHFLFDSLSPGRNLSLYIRKPLYCSLTSPATGENNLGLTIGLKYDSLNFGIGGLQRNLSISGVSFNDVNKNGVRDSGEFGMAGLTVRLTATLNGDMFVRSVVTDSRGNYSFGSLSPGTYIVAEALRPTWVPTLPLNFRPYIITLDTGMQRTGVDFGYSCGATNNPGFRSFISDSIALARNVSQRYGEPNRKQYITREIFTATFVNNSPKGLAGSSLRFGFSYPYEDSFVVVPPAQQTYDPRAKTVTFNFPAGVNPGEAVTIQGYFTLKRPSTRPSQLHVGGVRWMNGTYKWLANGRSVTAPWQYVDPNAVDALMAMPGNTILVGAPRDAAATHTVYLKDWRSVTLSLGTSYGAMHTGSPRCLCGPGSKIQMKYFPPNSDPSNILFAEAVALRVNIHESDVQVTPPGFGELIFDEGGDNPMNGKSIRTIENILDDYMSSWAAFGYCRMPDGYTQLDSMRFYQTVRKINSAFCGPFEYLSWTPGWSLTLLPVRGLSEVPYLHIDSTLGPNGKIRFSATAPIPDQFRLLQNFPNPFNPTTTIQFDLPDPAIVSLSIYNILGQEVVTLLNRQLFDAGSQSIDVDGGGLASGIYFYRITAERLNDDGRPSGQSFIQVKKMLLVK